jgi:hypothetical protein
MHFVIISLISGFLFWILEWIINYNPKAKELFQVYQPITRPSFNIPVSLLIYFIYGFALAGMFLLLYQSLPGQTGIIKGMSFAVLVTFFRIFMSVLSQWMSFVISGKALLYAAVTGLCETLIVGILYGLTLQR